MTPAAPTASWRKVCEEYFSRLMEDLEQQVESEVESRVAVAIEATVRGAVGDAVAAGRVQAPPLELLSEVAALQLQTLAQAQVPAPPERAMAAAQGGQPENQLVNITGSLPQPPAEAPGAAPASGAPQPGAWSRLSR